MRFYLRSADRRPDPPSPPTDDRRVVLIGTAIWAGLLAAAVLFHGWLAETGRGWWTWTPVAGVALGLYGLRYLSRRAGPPRA